MILGQLRMGERQMSSAPLPYHRESQREPERVRESQREPERARESQREPKRARERQRERQRDPERVIISFDYLF